MKAMIRILIILLAAFAVTGATWAIGQSSGSSSDSAFVQGDRPEFGNRAGQSAPTAGRAGGDHHAAQWTSVQGWLGFAETLVPITIIITLVTLPANLRKRNQRTRRHPAATAV